MEQTTRWLLRRAARRAEAVAYATFAWPKPRGQHAHAWTWVTRGLRRNPRAEAPAVGVGVVARRPLARSFIPGGERLRCKFARSLGARVNVLRNR